VVLDVAQIVASFASFGAMSITVKAGGAAAALSGSRWFVPLVGTAAGADVVQLVALTDITFAELNKIQNGAGTPEDKQRAMAVLFTQLIVASGLTALSVQGARNARALAGTPLELVDQKGVPLLRVVGDDSPAPVVRPAPAPFPDESAVTGGHQRVTHDTGGAASTKTPKEIDHTDVHDQLHNVLARQQSGPPTSWDKFDPTTNNQFKVVLRELRGTDNLSPNFAGGEGRIFAADGKLIALKRWFKVRLGDMPASVTKLRQVKADVESQRKLSADVDVVRVHEEGSDWILRDFDPNSVDLKAGPAEAQAARARAIAELEVIKSNGELTAVLADLLKKLKKQPPSANLHWSPSKGKILVIDMQ
jgi:hypothetical protein